MKRGRDLEVLRRPSNSATRDFIAHYLRRVIQGTLVPIFCRWVTAPARYLLVTTPASRRKPEVQEFIEWILRQAGDASRAHGP